MAHQILGCDKHNYCRYFQSKPPTPSEILCTRCPDRELCASQPKAVRKAPKPVVFKGWYLDGP